jgi:glycosyltransferase involved in cell wall biosynthesis
MNTAISAYIPCFNNEATVVQAIRSIREQSVPIAELFLIDDCSSDSSFALAEAEGISVIRNETNQGRGAVRASAMIHAKNELVLGCDAGIVLASDFVERSLPWLENDKVAAVHGRVLQPPATNAVERWRGRHLFKIDAKLKPSMQSLLLTGGAIVRKSIVLALGNYNERMLYGEDRDLGDKLLKAGFEVVFDPEMTMTAISVNNLQQVLERYCRWYATKTGKMSWFDYAKLISYSAKVMAREDLKANDWPSALISLLCPHYQFWSPYNSETLLP